MTSAIGRVLVSAGLDVSYEVAISGRLRPADIFIRGMSWPEPDIMDATMVNPMTDFDQTGPADRVAQAEENKHKKYDELCQRAKVKLTAFGVSTLGGVGPEAHQFLGRIRERLLKDNGKTEGGVLAKEAMERISVACQRSVAAQLLKSIGGLTSNEAAGPRAPTTAPSEQGESPAADEAAAMEQ